MCRIGFLLFSPPLGLSKEQCFANCVQHRLGTFKQILPSGKEKKNLRKKPAETADLRQSPLLPSLESISKQLFNGFCFIFNEHFQKCLATRTECLIYSEHDMSMFFLMAFSFLIFKKETGRLDKKIRKVSF